MYKSDKERVRELRLRRIAKYGGYPCSAMIDDNNRVIRLYRYKNPRSIFKYYKKVASKSFRRFPIEDTTPRMRSLHKKVFDYWWNVI